ncbi:MAG TPA: universal stress protein [Blastococcus sp.]|nr:universal stress protein [Blastococcus sp.]
MTTPAGTPGRIVVGVDGSESSADALRWAVTQARLTGAEVTAVMSWELPTNYAWGPVMDDTDWEADARTALEQAITETLDADEAAKVQRSVVRGHPARALLDAADGAALLVVGSRGHGGFSGLLLGSVSQHVITHATCPVLVVHGAAPTP